jgi:hypothetical protein
MRKTEGPKRLDSPWLLFNGLTIDTVLLAPVCSYTQRWPALAFGLVTDPGHAAGGVLPKAMKCGVRQESERLGTPSNEPPWDCEQLAGAALAIRELGRRCGRISVVLPPNPANGYLELRDPHRAGCFHRDAQLGSSVPKAVDQAPVVGQKTKLNADDSIDTGIAHFEALHIRVGTKRPRLARIEKVIFKREGEAHSLNQREAGVDVRFRRDGLTERDLSMAREACPVRDGRCESATGNDEQNHRRDNEKRKT